jgi:hypothetical protein
MNYKRACMMQIMSVCSVEIKEGFADLKKPGRVSWFPRFPVSLELPVTSCPTKPKLNLSFWPMVVFPDRSHNLRRYFKLLRSPYSKIPRINSASLCILSPGIDSQPGGPVRQSYLTYRSASLLRLAKSIPWNRFLGSLNAGLWRAGTITLFLLGS